MGAHRDAFALSYKANVAIMLPSTCLSCVTNVFTTHFCAVRSTPDFERTSHPSIEFPRLHHGLSSRPVYSVGHNLHMYFLRHPIFTVQPHGARHP